MREIVGYIMVFMMFYGIYSFCVDIKNYIVSQMPCRQVQRFKQPNTIQVQKMRIKKRDLKYKRSCSDV